MQFGQWHKCRWISVNHTQWRGQKPSKINGSFDKWVFLIQLWYRELKRFSARKWQNLHNSPLSLSNSRLHENCVSQLYENCAFLHIFWGENGTVILVGCNSPFCENCFSLRFRDFSKSRSNQGIMSPPIFVSWDQYSSLFEH